MPGTRLEQQWDLYNKDEKDQIVKKILKDETPITIGYLRNHDIEYKSLGCWRHIEDHKEYMFDNIVIELSESFRHFPNAGKIKKIITKNKIKHEITGEPFSILDLPVGSIYSLTQNFLKSSLFHDSGHIPSIANEDQRDAFRQSLGNDHKRFYLFRVIKSGGYGLVYATLDIATLFPRVVKVPLNNPHDPNWQKRFLREGNALLSLIHEGVRGIEEIFSINRIGKARYYLLKEYIRGRDLQDSIALITDSHVLSIITQIINVLAEVHELEICHRDLKPNNIMIELQGNGDPEITLIDFGLVKSTYGTPGENPHLTPAEFRTGSPLFQSVITYKRYYEHNLLDDYYSVLHIYYWLIAHKHFYVSHYRTSIEDAKIKAGECKSKYQDPFLDENAIADFCEERSGIPCIKQLAEFHKVIRQAYDKIYDKQEKFELKNEFKDKEILREQLKETTKNILAVFG